MPVDRRFRGATIPVVLILAGVVLLLNTLNIVNWAIWHQLVRLWPVVVIGFGASLLIQHFRRTKG